MKIYLIIVLFYVLPMIINWLIFHLTYIDDNHDSPGTFEVMCTFMPVFNGIMTVVFIVGGCISGIIDISKKYIIDPISNWNWNTICRRIFLLGDQDEEI